MDANLLAWLFGALPAWFMLTLFCLVASIFYSLGKWVELRRMSKWEMKK